jgi:phenylalanyl-tRNA synthetase alpha chain
MDDLRQKYLDAISNAADEAALEETRLAAVGKKGEVSLKMRELGKMTPEERQVAGPALNALKDEINSALAAKKAALADAAFPSDRGGHRNFRRHGFWCGRGSTH